MNKNGQITIFVLLAIILVGGIVIYLTISSKEVVLEKRGEEFNPETFIDKCVREEIRDTVKLLLPQGGFMTPQDYVTHNDIKVSYLCKNINYF